MYNINVLNAFAIKPKPVEHTFAGFEGAPRMDLVEAGLLVTQAKWEERPWDRISSCYPAAIINGALLSGALEPEVGHLLHSRLVELPDNWIYTTHPDRRVETKIQGFRFGAELQSTILGWGADDILYQHYANWKESKAFKLKQLMHADTGVVLVDGKPARTSKQLIRGVLEQVVMVSSINQHATTIVLHEGGILEINPRQPHNPVAISLDELGRTWAKKTGPVTGRRLLEAVIKPYFMPPEFLVSGS